MSNKENISSSCRYLDSRRRLIIPSHLLAEAGIPPETMMYLEEQNGCLIIRPVVGITVRDNLEQNKLIKKGRW